MAGLSLLLALLLLGVAAVVWVAVQGGGGTDRYVVATPTSGPGGPDAAGAGDALGRLQRDLRTGDLEAASALAGSDDPSTASLLADLTRTVRAAHLVDVTFRYVDEQGGTDSDGVWRADVNATWRFAGFDRAPATADVVFSFRRTSNGVRIAGIGGSQLRTPVWMSGPVQVHRSRTVLVLAEGSTNRLSRYVRLADRAVPAVRSVVRRWRPRLVVEVPDDLDGLDRALGEQPGADAQIAAVTTSVDGTSTPQSPVHVLVNPDVFDRLPTVGAQVVLTHESTHVATDAYLSQAPTWLKEGIADYTALREVRLPFSKTAGQVIASVRRDGLPTRLPSAADFDPDAEGLGGVYEAAWLVCVTLADRGGAQALLDLYDRTSRGVPLARSLPALFGWTVPELVAAWRSRLADLADSATAREGSAVVPRAPAR